MNCSIRSKEATIGQLFCSCRLRLFPKVYGCRNATSVSEATHACATMTPTAKVHCEAANIYLELPPSSLGGLGANGKENGNYYSILGLYRDNGKENGNYYSILGLYRDNGKENGNYYSILGLYRDNGKEKGNYYSILGLYRDNGKENGNYYSILGLYRDNGKENGNYYSILGYILGLYANPQVVIMENWGSMGPWKRD